MMELFHAAFSGVNFIPTLLLVFVLLYWMLVIFGAVDISSVDIDIDVDVDMDADVEVDADGASEASVSWLNYILRFFNLDKIPLMVFLTFVAIPMWVISIMVNHTLGNTSVLISLALLVPNFIVSLIIAKPLTIPFVKMFSYLEDSSEGSPDLMGREGTVVIGASSSKMGQGDVLVAGSNYRINIKTKNDSIKRGQKMLVINESKNEGYYIVEPYETIN